MGVSRPLSCEVWSSNGVQRRGPPDRTATPQLQLGPFSGHWRVWKTDGVLVLRGQSLRFGMSSSWAQRRAGGRTGAPAVRRAPGDSLQPRGAGLTSAEKLVGNRGAHGVQPTAGGACIAAPHPGLLLERVARRRHRCLIPQKVDARVAAAGALWEALSQTLAC